MSRPQPKRRRLHDRSPAADDPLPPSTSHIFEASSNPSASRSTTLHPSSYEINLNHDLELKRSLQPPSFTSPSSPSGSRLVTWTSSRGDSVISDRYDALHLLPSLPAPSSPSVHPDDDSLGWSDLDSDTEDLFYMTSAEAASFAHRRALTALEDQRSSRLSQLGPSPPPSQPAEPAEAGLTATQFELMRKTARSMAGSRNAKLLEMRIVANHGADARFGFLTSDAECGAVSSVWAEVKRRKGLMSYQDALAFVADERRERGKRLVAYDDSDSDQDPAPKSEQQDQAPQPPQTQSNTRHRHGTSTRDTSSPIETPNASRIARAKHCLQARSSLSTTS